MTDFAEQVVIRDIAAAVKALNDASLKARELGIEIALSARDNHFIGQPSLRTFSAKAVKITELDVSSGVR